MSVRIEAVALLNICDYSTRLSASDESVHYIGGLHGAVFSNSTYINQAFELKMLGPNEVDMEYLARKDELFRGINPNHQMVGWFVVGETDIKHWMYEVQAQISQAVDSPVLGLFEIPFAAELNKLPFKFYDLVKDSFAEIPVQMQVAESGQIALQDALSARGSSGSIESQLSKETRAMLFLHQHLTKLKEYLDSDPEPSERLAEVLSVVQQTCRSHDFGASKQYKELEQDVLTELTAALVIRGDAILATLLRR